MSVPKSVTKFTKEGVEFTSSVDKVNYTIQELSRAALRDVGKYVCRTFRKLFYAEFKRKTGRVGKYTQYWVRKNNGDMPDLQVGLKPFAFYGAFQEYGTSSIKKHGFLTNAVYDNIDTIIKIESQYLSALEDEAEALSIIDEEEYVGGADDE